MKGRLLLLLLSLAAVVYLLQVFREPQKSLLGREAPLLPESYLVDRQGRVVQKYVGPRDWIEPALVQEILSYVEGK